MNTTTAPTYEIIWADRQEWNGPEAVEIRVRILEVTDAYADYRRDRNGVWTVLTMPMTYTESGDRGRFLLTTPLPVAREVWDELNTLTTSLLG